jgi:hypothetical protein
LLETLQIQLTLQCLSNLTEDGPLGAKKRLLLLKEELRDVKKKLADVSAAYIGMRTENPNKSSATQIHNNADGFNGPPADLSSSAKLHGTPTGSAAASVFRPVRVIDLSSDSEEDAGRASRGVLDEKSDLHNRKPNAEKVQLATLKRKRVSLGTKHPRNPVKADSVRTRQPEAKNAWYSHLVPSSHKAWASGTLTLERKRALSSVGHIEETIAGVPAPSPCDHCKSMGYDCRVYDPATAELYCREEHWNSCSRCFARGRDQAALCTITPYPRIKGVHSAIKAAHNMVKASP